MKRSPVGPVSLPAPGGGFAVADLDDDELVDALCGWEALKSLAEARQQEVLAELCVRRAGEDDFRFRGESADARWVKAEEFVAEEAAACLGVSVGTGWRRVAEANRVHECLPMLADALVRGGVDVARARLLIHETNVLSEELAADVVSELLKVADRMPWTRLKQLARALVIAADPELAEVSARDEARRERSVRRQTLSETMTRLIADLTHTEAALLWDHIDNGARSSLQG